MKYLKLLLAVLGLSVVASGVQAQVILDWGTTPNNVFTYNLGGTESNSATFSQLSSTTGGGGAGSNGWSVGSIDLSGFATQTFQLSMREITGDQTDTIRVELFSNGFTRRSDFIFDVSGLNDTTFTNVVSTTALNAPTGTSGGGAVDLANIDAIQLVVASSSGTNIGLQFENLNVVPEPSTYALLSATFIMFGIVYFRRKKLSQISR